MAHFKIIYTQQSLKFGETVKSYKGDCLLLLKSKAFISPGLDGWMEIIEVLDDIRRTSQMPSTLNSTYITLIPKRDKLESMITSQYLFIIFSTSFIKKAIVNILKPNSQIQLNIVNDF